MFIHYTFASQCLRSRDNFLKQVLEDSPLNRYTFHMNPDHPTNMLSLLVFPQLS